MDDHSFDTLTRNLGSGFSRRGALRAALGGLMAAAGANALSAEAKNGKQAKSQDKQRKRLQAQTNPPPQTCQGECDPGKPWHCNQDDSIIAGESSPCRCFSHDGPRSGPPDGPPDGPKKGACGQCIEDGKKSPGKEFCCSDDYDWKTKTCGQPQTCAGTPCGNAGLDEQPDPCKKFSDCVCGNEGYCIEKEPPKTCSTTTCDPQVAGDDPCKKFSDCVCGNEGYCVEKTPPPCSDSCDGKRCGEKNECGEICGGCDHGFCVIDDDGQDAHCKTPPVCAPNGEPGICCSGYHRHDGICCDADDPGAVSITVTTSVFNSITITTPPNTTIVTVNVPPTPVPPTPPRRRRRRHHHHRGGRH